MGDTINLIKNGNAVTVPVEQAPALIAEGYAPESEHAQLVRNTQEERIASAPGKFVSGSLAVARGLTLGGSDIVGRAIGGKTYAKFAQSAAEAHPDITTGGTIVGAALPALVTAGESIPESIALAPSSLASGARVAVAERLGGGLLARAAGGAVEGGIYGAGNAASEIALSEDPLTAENIMGHMSSNVLLGGALGGGISLLSHGVGAALNRAGTAMREAAAAKGALSSVPEDLAGLDEAGLKAELKRATVAHEADKAAETSSLESLRRDQRTELANQILDTHEEIRASKIYQAVNDDFTKLEGKAAGVEKIDGITNAQRQLAASNASLSRLGKNPVALADNPGKAIEALQMRQSALETMQERMPQLRSALADNPAGAGLETVDSALAQTKLQIEAIRALDSKVNPVTSSRLELLKAGPSQRMEQVAAAQRALADGKDLGLVGKGIKSVATTAASGLSHFLPIPGASFAAHWMGEKAGSAVEWLARKLSGTAAKSAEATAGHAAAFLDVAAKAPRVLKGPAVATATKTLSSVRLGASGAAEPKADDLRALARARMNELKTQTMYAPQPDGTFGVTMRPEARAAMAKSFDGIRHVAPVLADKLETVAARRAVVQSQAMPRKPDVVPGQQQIGPDNWSPSDMAIRRWARIVRATEDPESVEARLAHGVISPEEAKAYRDVYPERFAALQRTISAALPTLSKTLPMRKKISLSIFSGIPVTPAMRPEILKTYQATFAVEPGSAGGTQAPRPQPNFGALGSLRDLDKPTPAQRRQA
jgi:hypothetical protein